MTVTVAIRLIRACATSSLTIRETACVFAKVRRGEWVASTNRELLAQAKYLRLLDRS